VQGEVADSFSGTFKDIKREGTKDAKERQGKKSIVFSVSLPVLRSFLFCFYICRPTQDALECGVIKLHFSGDMPREH
jgi:hypothetical protein